MDKQPVSYYQADHLSKSIARAVKKDKVTHVLGLARGGLVPATIISYKLKVPLLSYAVSTYKDTTKTNELKVVQDVNFSSLAKGSKLLVVDDICDSGDTIKFIKKQIKKVDGITAIYSTLFTKKKTKRLLNHYGVVVSGDTWIDFPWE